MHSRSVALALSVLLLGCGESPSGPFGDVPPDDSAETLIADPDALFQSDSAQYGLTSIGELTTATVVLTFTNRTAKPANFVNCQGATALTLQRLDGERWENIWSPILLACLSAPIVVEPGKSRAFPVRIVGSPQGSRTYPQFEKPLTRGVYRIVFGNVVHEYQDRLPWGASLALAQRISNRFILAPTAP